VSEKETANLINVTKIVSKYLEFVLNNFSFRMQVNITVKFFSRGGQLFHIDVEQPQYRIHRQNRRSMISENIWLLSPGFKRYRSSNHYGFRMSLTLSKLEKFFMNLMFY
jgi:hypothetical protein